MLRAFNDIEKILLLSQQNRQQITELDLSSVKIFRFTGKIRRVIEECRNLVILKLSECELSTLDKLPALGLVALDVSGNKLKDSDLQHLTIYPNLSMLNLSDNLIKYLSSLEHIKKLHKLKDLQLAGNQVQKHPSYREQVFGQIKGLELLDKLDHQGQPPAYDSYSDDALSQSNDEQQSGSFDQQQDQSNNQELDESQMMEKGQMGANLYKKRKQDYEQESQSDS